MTNYIFNTPYVEEGPSGSNSPLWRFYKIRQGITVVKSGSTYATRRWISEDDYSKYDAVYRGGYAHQVTEAEKAALIAGGIGVTEANFTAI